MKISIQISGGETLPLRSGREESGIGVPESRNQGINGMNAI